jgi:hypothetical protein
LRSARLQGRREVGPARLLVAMLRDLGVSTLRSIKTMTQFSSLLSIKSAMLPASMLEDYSTSASSMPSCFPRRIDLLGNPFLRTSLLDLLSLLFSFLDHHTIVWTSLGPLPWWVPGSTSWWAPGTTRHLMAWGARTTVEKYSDRKLYMSDTM